MPPICETKGHVTNLRSSHDELNCEAEKSGHSNQEAKNTISLEQKQKLAYDDNEIRILKTKKLLDDKNNQEKQVSVDHSVKRVSSTEPEKYNPKGLNLKDIDAYVDKLKELFQRQSGLQNLDGFDDEISDGHSDAKATAKTEIPTELESVIVNEQNVQGVTKCSEDSKGTNKEDDSDNDDKDEDNPQEGANENEIAVPEEADVPVVQAQSKRTNREDSDVLTEEATECASPVGKAKFVIGVVSATETRVKGQIEPTYLPVVEGKNSNWLPDHMDLVSLNTTVTTNVSPNDNLLDDLPKEEQTEHSNNSSELVFTGTNSNGATTFLTVEEVDKLQDTSMHPYFSAPAGAAGDSPMESSHENSEPQDDDDVISLEGSVSDNTSFKSGPADAFDPDMHNK